MKNLIITSIIALGVAAPAVAQSVNDLTPGQFAQVHTQAGNDSANERNTFFGNTKINFSASDIHNERAAAIFARLKAESLEDE